MHKGRIKKRDQPFAPLQSLLAGSSTPYLTFLAVVLLSGSGSPYRQWLLPDGSPPRCPWPAKTSRWLSATVPLAGKSFPMALHHSAAILFAIALPASISATAPQPAKASRWFSATVPPSSSPWHSRPAAPPRRPAQQQTSSGGEEYSGLASNLAHLGRIC